MPLYALPRLAGFLRDNAPWEQLLRLGNAEIRVMDVGTPVDLNGRLSVTPFEVPHRDEYSETAGYRIEGPSRAAVYIPDIDSWDGLDPTIEELISTCDVAFIDGTFFDAEELPGRDMTEIPHPPVVKTMRRLNALPEAERKKVRFIHFNHTNPLLRRASAAVTAVREAGFGIAEQGEVFGL
jgi:pyrroloquinoline quinone biosynthesis protein B